MILSLNPFSVAYVKLISITPMLYLFQFNFIIGITKQVIKALLESPIDPYQENGFRLAARQLILTTLL